jgi:hypothetical protein
MTRVSLDGSPLGLTMLCRGSKIVRLLLHKDAGSPTLDEYCELDQAEQVRAVRVYFILHPDEKVTGAWVRVRKCFNDHHAQPVLKVRTCKTIFWADLTNERSRRPGKGRARLGHIYFQGQSRMSLFL